MIKSMEQAMKRVQPYHPPQEKIDQMMSEQNRVPVQFTLYCGNAGDGKTLLLNRHILAWFAFTEIRGTYEDCYSNIHVRTPDWWEGRPRETKNLELTGLAESIKRTIEHEDNDEKEINQHLEQMHDCMCAWDEMQNVADRQNWHSVKSRLYNYILMQRRHQHYHMAGTVQNPQWLNPRTMYQIDFQVLCKSMHRFASRDFADWERIPGQYIWVRIRDLSGLVRPYSYDEDHYEKTLRIGPNWPFWDSYDTLGNQDVFEPFNKLEIKGKRQRLGAGSEDTNDNFEPRPGGNAPDYQQHVVEHILNECLSRNYATITRDNFRAMCHDYSNGQVTDPGLIGRILSTYRVQSIRRNGTRCYDFSALTEEAIYETR